MSALKEMEVAMSTSDDIGWRQLRRRGGGVFVSNLKSRLLNDLKSAIIASEADPHDHIKKEYYQELKLICQVAFPQNDVEKVIEEAHQAVVA